MYLNSFILKNNLLQTYAIDFNDYAIKTMYGTNILIGEDIEDDYKDIPPEGE